MGLTTFLLRLLLVVHNSGTAFIKSRTISSWVPVLS